MIQQVLTTSFKKQLLEGVHDFMVGGNAFKIALYTSSATLNSSTTAYTALYEVSATGYTAGGAALTNVNPASSGTVGYTSFSAVTWTSDDIVARGALIYNHDALGYTDPSVMVLDFGMDRYSQSGVFTVTFPVVDSQTAIIRIT